MKPTIHTSIIGITTLVAGFMGGQMIEQTLVDTLRADLAVASTTLSVARADRDSAIGDKQRITDGYLYAQLTSGRLPDLATSDSTTLLVSYAKMLNERKVPFDFSTQDLGAVLVQDLQDKGEVLTCN